jgi:AcrR family transcriptional regulator
MVQREVSTPHSPEAGGAPEASASVRPLAAGAKARARGRSGRPYGGRALNERVAERRGRFIAAGTQVFGTVGLRNATVRGVCNTAGLTDRYFYESFENLEALLQAVYLHLMSRYRNRLSAMGLPRLRAGEDAWAGIESDLRIAQHAWFELVREPTFARVVLDEVLGVSPTVDALYESCTREFAVLTLVPVLERLPALRDNCTPQQLTLIGRAVTGPPIHMAKYWANNGYLEPIDQVMRTSVVTQMGALRALIADVSAASD